MPVFDGREGERFFVCRVDDKEKSECIEYMKKDSAKKTAINEAKKTGKEHIIIYVFGDEEKVVGTATPDGNYVDLEEETEAKVEEAKEEKPSETTAPKEKKEEATEGSE